jgi:outer membrane protein assembly complex protein YaeT
MQKARAAETSFPFFWREMIFRKMPAAIRSGILLASVLIFRLNGFSQNPSQNPAPVSTASSGTPAVSLATTESGDDPLEKWEGIPVQKISFEGVSVERLAPLPDHLEQKQGQALSSDNLKKSLRQLFATGLFETIQVEGSRDGDGVNLLFRGEPRTFIGTVGVNGAKGAAMNTQLERSSQLEPGTRFTQAKLNRALEQMRSTLADNGFHDPTITQKLTQHPESQLVDIAFQVSSGPQARIGEVQVTGDSGMSVDEFRRRGHLKAGARVDHDTVNRALTGVLKHYQGQQRLEAEIKLASQQYSNAAQKTSFNFTANRGPVVKVLVQGVKMDQEHVKHVIPIYEEGTVDDDLLNEGNRRLRDYYQRLGYFDVRVDHEIQTTKPEEVLILYQVRLGPRRRLQRVSMAGNHYFDSGTLEELLAVHAADPLDRHGSYSQALVSADVSSLQAVYQNNGFSKVGVTPETSTPETVAADNRAVVRGSAVSDSSSSLGLHTEPLTLVYRIDEGNQLRVGTVQIEGTDHVDVKGLSLLLNTAPGQLLSPQNLAGDRDALLTDYVSRGFLKAAVDVTQMTEAADASKVDVVFHVTEGQQIFVRNVLITGLHYTRPDTVAKAITLHPGDPLNETALMDTQRNLYEFALFNEVDTAVENPSGDEANKTVLLQAVEARRWTFTYGFGFEAQTGTPQYNCGGIIASGAVCNPNGKTGVSPRVLADLTRNNLFGREQSASVQGNYGLLEQKIGLLYQVPHFQGRRDFGLSFTGGYANSLDVTTYVASKLDAGIRLTENFNTPGIFFSKANTFVYEFDFRRVKVQASSLQVAPEEIALESAAVRVAGPSLTWIRDTRDSPLDAHRGTYTSFQEFLSAKDFGAQAQFNRLDVSNSSYYSFNKGRYVLARNTRYGQERAFGASQGELIPLPERLYAGGSTSLRGFPENAAGPRDPETGYPIGGAGVLINSTEFRLPPPMLPWLGNSMSFVLFHDMGNVFTNASDAWASALRVSQPERDTCKELSPPSPPNASPPPPSGPVTSTGAQGNCSFNYFSHTIGIGLRYHTPAGPLRLDFSYNLNPPIYPVIYNYSLPQPASAPYVGAASHFNFFFSFGQTF